MKQFIFAIRDIKSGFANTLLLYPNKEVAIRHYRALCSDEASLLCKCKEDFELWCLGSYDMTNGTIESAPEFIFSMVGAN